MPYHRGFSFSASFFLTVCGLSLTAAQDCKEVYVDAKKGELKSANFPSPYQENSCTEWIFHKEQGEVATLSFTYLDLPKDAETGACFSNYIEIRSHTGQKVICGEDAAPYISPEDETQFTVFFFSGSHSAGHGFKISYMIGPAVAKYCAEGEFQCGDYGKCINSSWRCNSHSECEDNSDEINCSERGHHYFTPAVPTLPPTTRTPTLRPSFEDLYTHQKCNDVLRNRSGWIRHLVRRGQRGPQTCRWLIQLPRNVYRITLMFKQMNFYTSVDNVNAYIVVYQGSEAELSNSLGVFPRRDANPFSVTSNTHAMLVVFNMESASTQRELVFAAEYFSEGYDPPSTTSRPAECYHRLSYSQGNFTMPPPPYDVRDIRDCQWHIYKPYRSRADPTIHLIFNSLSLQHGASVVVYDGEDRWATVLGRYNSSRPVSRPISLWSTGRDLLVSFTAPPYSLDIHPLWIQFTATYHFEEMCEEYNEIRCGDGSNRCYTAEQRCNAVLDCPVTGADETGCHGCSADMYSCRTYTHIGGNMGCYSRHDRCNGASTCENRADEKNCDSKTCSEEHDLFLCANKNCILYEYICDGRDDCDDGSDELDCKDVVGSRYIIVWAVGGSLLGGLLLVLSVGIACKVYALRHQQTHPHPHSHPHHSRSRYDTPLSRLQAEMFRRRAPPPPYHEAMLTSRPYDEAVREFLAQQSQQAAAAEQENRGAEQSGAAGEAAASNDRSVHNLINLMDFEEVDEHRQPLGDAEGRLEICITQEGSSDSDSDDDDDEEGEEDGDNPAEDGSGHIEMSQNLGHRRAGSGSQRINDEETERILLENISQDSASADSNDSGSLAEETPKDSDKEGGEPKVGEDEGGNDSNKDSDTDSVCILCLDNDQNPCADDDGTDTRCLLQDV